MADCSYPHRDSDFFRPIVEFLVEDNGNEDGELDELPPSGRVAPPKIPHYFGAVLLRS